jgi:hypothetical protein
MAVVWNIPIACNRATADFMISSPLMDGEYDRLVQDYSVYRRRKVPVEEPEVVTVVEIVEEEIAPLQIDMDLDESSEQEKETDFLDNGG